MGADGAATLTWVSGELIGACETKQTITLLVDPATGTTQTKLVSVNKDQREFYHGAIRGTAGILTESIGCRPREPFICSSKQGSWSCSRSKIPVIPLQEQYGDRISSPVSIAHHAT